MQLPRNVTCARKQDFLNSLPGFCRKVPLTFGGGDANGVVAVDTGNDEEL